MSNETEAVKSAIETLADKATTATEGVQAQQFAQAALNMAHVRAALANMGK